MMAFTASHPSLAPFTLSAAAYLAANNKHWDGLASGVIVFNAAHTHVLTVQRAAHDSMPNRWEIPGGAVDEDDETILHAAARETLEESGLVVTRFVRAMPYTEDAPGPVCTNTKGTILFCRITFVAEVEGYEVKLDPNEHQDWEWCTEEEIRNEEKEGRKMRTTHENQKAVILKAFAMIGED